MSVWGKVDDDTNKKNWAAVFDTPQVQKGKKNGKSKGKNVEKSYEDGKPSERNPTTSAIISNGSVTENAANNKVVVDNASNNKVVVDNASNNKVVVDNISNQAGESSSIKDDNNRRRRNKNGTGTLSTLAGDSKPSSSTTSQKNQPNQQNRGINNNQQQEQNAEDQQSNGTIQPNNGTTEANNGTIQPNDGTIQPNNGTTEPNNGTTQPSNGTAQSSQTPTSPQNSEYSNTNQSLPSNIQLKQNNSQSNQTQYSSAQSKNSNVQNGNVSPSITQNGNNPQNFNAQNVNGSWSNTWSNTAKNNNINNTTWGQQSSNTENQQDSNSQWGNSQWSGKNQWNMQQQWKGDNQQANMYQGGKGQWNNSPQQQWKNKNAEWGNTSHQPQWSKNGSNSQWGSNTQKGKTQKGNTQWNSNTTSQWGGKSSQQNSNNSQWTPQQQWNSNPQQNPNAQWNSNQQQNPNAQWNSNQQQNNEWGNQQQDSNSQWGNQQQNSNSQWGNQQQNSNSEWGNQQQNSNFQWCNHQQKNSWKGNWNTPNKGHAPTVKNKGNTPTVKTKGNTSTVKTKGNTPSGIIPTPSPIQPPAIVPTVSMIPMTLENSLQNPLQNPLDTFDPTVAVQNGTKTLTATETTNTLVVDNDEEIPPPPPPEMNDDIVINGEMHETSKEIAANGKALEESTNTVEKNETAENTESKETNENEVKEEEKGTESNENEVVKEEEKEKPPPPKSWAEAALRNRDEKKVFPLAGAVASRNVSILDCIAYLADSKLEDLDPRKKHLQAQVWGSRIDLIIASKGKIDIGPHAFFIRGLNNMRGSNVCYVNCVIQLLIAVQPLMNLLSMSGAGDSSRPFTMALKDVCRSFHKPATPGESGITASIPGLPFSIVEHQSFENILKNWQSKRNTQQDASEFLLYLLQKIHEEMSWYTSPKSSSIMDQESDEDSSQYNEEDEWETVRYDGNNRRIAVEKRDDALKEDSVVMRIFSHVLQSKTLGRHNTTITMEPFFLFNVTMENQNGLVLNGGTDCSTVVDGELNLHQMVQSQASEVQEDSDFRHERNICRFPPYMVIVLKRFKFHRADGSLKKITRGVRFSEYMDIKKPGSKNSVNYRLTACISHQGEQADSGHYVAYTRHNDDWFRYDDSKVASTEVSKFSLDQHLQQNIYILMYQKVSDTGIRILP